MKWVEALKAYAQKKGKYVVPRKGSAEYAEVMALMGKAHTDVAKADIEKGQAKRDVKKMDKVARMAETMHEASPTVDKPARAMTSQRKANAGMVVKSNLGATARAVAKSKNPDAIFESATNTHEPLAPLGAVMPNTAELKKDLAKVRKPRNLPELVEKEKVEDAIPFSFVSFKRKIGA